MSNIHYNDARFILSASTLEQCPPDTGSEVAFAGYSNTGKSSVINCITGVRGLARASKSPGRTRLLNFFSLGEERRLVDLPGYGYARVPAATRRQWEMVMCEYLEKRCSLRGLMLIMDARNPLKTMDRHLLGWCHEADVPVRALLNKCDKLSRSAGLQVLHETAKQLHDGASAQLFSARDRTGVDESRKWLDARLNRKERA